MMKKRIVLCCFISTILFSAENALTSSDSLDKEQLFQSINEDLITLCPRKKIYRLLDLCKKYFFVCRIISLDESFEPVLKYQNDKNYNTLRKKKS